MIVGHEAGIFATAEEFDALNAWLADSGWTVRRGIPKRFYSNGQAVLVFEASPEEQRRIADGEDWAEVLAS